MGEGVNLLNWGLPAISIAILLIAWWILNGRLGRLRLNDQLELEKLEAESGLPVQDPVRFGAAKIANTLI